MNSGTFSKRPLRVIFVGARDSGGGAARATYRIFDSLWQRQQELGLEITLRVITKTTTHPGIIGGQPQRTLTEIIRTRVVKKWRRVFKREKFFSPHTIYDSPAEFDTGLGRELANLDADIFVMNWLGSKTLSVREVSKIQAKTVWRLTDMWVFSGAEHYRFNDRAAVGYAHSSRPEDETGPDIHRRIFLKKKRLWKHAMPLIATTSWLASQAQRSKLSKNWPIYIQPNPLDTKFWRPLEREISRRQWNFSEDEFVVLFGAAGGTKYPHKGASVLRAALQVVHEQLSEKGRTNPLTLAIFGEDGEPGLSEPFRTIYLGKLDDESLRAAYSAADIAVVPSLLEAFGQVASEAHACGLPAVVFDDTGLTDIVENGETGFHARNNDPQDLAEKITKLLADSALRQKFGRAARERAVRLWDTEVVATGYARILHEVAEKSRQNNSSEHPTDSTVN